MIPADCVRSTMPASKLTVQAPYFTFPAWIAVPTVDSPHANGKFYLEKKSDPQVTIDLCFAYIIVGSSTSLCDHSLKGNSSISRTHCALVFHGSLKCFVAVDLNSTNGVEVDGARVKQESFLPLFVGSEITFGTKRNVDTDETYVTRCTVDVPPTLRRKEGHSEPEVIPDEMEKLRRLAAAANATTHVVKANAEKVACSPDDVLSVPLPPELMEIPEAIRAVVPKEKLLRQCRVFKIPPWTGAPTIAMHLQVMREGCALPSWDLRRFPFYLIGSSNICDIRLENQSISRTHCVLVWHRDLKSFVAVDTSTNGVWLDGVRIERETPTPVRPESVLKFGSSTRTYTMKNGVAVKNVLTSASLQKGCSDVRGTSEPRPLPLVSAEATGDLNAVQQAATSVDSESADSSPRHLRHILIKHKDVEKPISANPKNKGEKITRSEEGAFDLCRNIRQLYESWDEGTFSAMAIEWSEDVKSKKGGDLGMVSRGDFDEAFEMPVFNLKSNEVSQPIATSLGVHLVFRCVS